MEKIDLKTRGLEQSTTEKNMSPVDDVDESSSFKEDPSSSSDPNPQAAMAKVMQEITEQNAKFIEHVKTLQQKEILDIKNDFQNKLNSESERLKRNFNNDITKKTQDSKEKIIEILGIFVALFTFVSVDIRFFSSDITFLSLVGFTLITLGGLAFFVLFLHISLRIGEDWKLYPQTLFKHPVFLAVLFLLGSGIWFVAFEGFHGVLRKDFFLEKQKESRDALFMLENNLATTAKVVGSIRNCTKQFNSYWEFKACLNK